MRFALSMVCIAALTACGGGGGGDNESLEGPLANAPACQVGETGYPEKTIAPDTCKALQVAMNDAIAKRNEAVLEANAAKAKADEATAMYNTVYASAGATAKQLADAQAAEAEAKRQLVAANEALAKAQEDLKNATGDAAAALAAAREAEAKAAADLASAEAARTQAAADRAEAEVQARAAAGDREAATAQAQAAQLASAAAERDLALANQARATAEAKAAEAQAAEQKAATDAATAKSDAEKAAADRAAAAADLASAEAARDLAIALNQQSAAMQDAAAARLEEVRVITANLPLCRELATGVTPQMGVNCVYTIADQLAMGGGGNPNPQPTITENLYTSDLGIALVEANGDMWWLDQTGVDGAPNADAGMLRVSSMNPLAAAGKSLTWTNADITMTGAFDALGVTYSRVISQPDPVPAGGYPATTRNFVLGANPAFQTNFAVAANARSQGGQNFLSGEHVAQIVFNDAGTAFTGYDQRCTYSGTMTDTTKGYVKVAVTWGAECGGNLANRTGAGIITYYGENTLLMVKTTGQWFDQGFVSFFNRTWPVTPMPAAPAAEAARESAQSAKKKTYTVDELPALFGRR